MADWPVKSLGDKTLLQYAKTPYMDKLARMGRVGRLNTVAEGFHPGSEVANMSVLGYNLPKVYEGRGPLEAASIGVDLQPGEMAMRCNLICVEGEILKNHSGAITVTSQDATCRIDPLIRTVMVASPSFSATTWPSSTVATSLSLELQLSSA